MTTAARISQIPAVGEYRIDVTASTMTFRTRHIFGLAPVNGSFRLREGHIRVADPVGESAVHATVSAASFHTGVSARDTTIRSGQYLDVENHPDITFASTGLAQRDGRWVLHGTLTVRGRGCPVDVPVEESEVDGPRVRLRASARVDRYAFGITAMKGMTGRWLTFVLELQANRV
jgi:polyisoprenoid-binding protein YceI